MNTNDPTVVMMVAFAASCALPLYCATNVGHIDPAGIANMSMNTAARSGETSSAVKPQ